MPKFKASYTGRRSHVVRSYRKAPDFDQVAPQPSVTLPGTWQYAKGDSFSGATLDSSLYGLGMPFSPAGGDTWDELQGGVKTVTHTVDGGALKLYPTRGPRGPLVSRHITTAGKWTSPTDKRFYVEVSAKLAKGKGRWPSIWLFNLLDTQASSRPEVDIMESGAGLDYGRDGTPYAGTMNAWRDDGQGGELDWPGGGAVGQTNNDMYIRFESPTLTTAFHTWGVDCDPVAGTIDFYFDGRKLNQMTGMQKTLTKPMFMIFAENYRTSPESNDPGPYNLGALGNLEELVEDHDPFVVNYWHCWTTQASVLTPTAPVVAAPLAAQSAIVQAPFTYQVPAGAFTDANNDALTYSATGLPAWLTFTPATRTFSGTPPAGSAGVSSIVVKATDPGGLFATSTFLLTATQAVVVNQPPVRNTEIPAQTAVEDTAYTYQVPAAMFTDPEAGALTYSASGLPAWLTFTPATRTFSGTPLQAHSGTSATVTLVVTDPQGASVSTPFALAVTAVNDAPVAALAVPNQTATVGVAFSYQVPAGTFTDVDGDSLTYSASGLPAWLTFTPATRTFTGTPTAAAAATTITLTARDPGNLTATRALLLTVGAAVNQAPVIATTIPGQTARVGTAFSYAIPAGTFNDPNNDALAITVAGLPAWASWSSATRTISGTPAASNVGSSTLTVTAADPGGLSVQTTVALAVVEAAILDSVANPVTQPLTAAAGSTTYNVGPGKTYTELDQINWAALVAGDVVNIFHRSTPYVAKFGIRGRGTASKRIFIHGVTDASGNRPRITGAGAKTVVTTPRSFSTNWMYGENLGIIVVMRGPEGVDPYNYRPGYISIQNLDIYGADPGATWTDTAGVQHVYDGFASAIRVQQVEDIRIDNCWLHDSVFGLYTQQPQANNGTSDCTDVWMTRCRTWNCGIVGSYLEHGVYTQARRERFYGNYFGPLKVGAMGSSFKSRGAGTQIVGCTIIAAQRAIDLVHDEAIPGYQDADPRYGYDVVANNLIINDLVGTGVGSIRPIHFGADNGHFDEEGDTALTDYPGMTDTAQDGTRMQRKARRTLLFYGNTLYSNSTAGISWRQFVFDASLSGTTLSPRPEIIEWNNAYHLGGTSNYMWHQYAGKLTRKGGSRYYSLASVGNAHDRANPAFWEIGGLPVGTSTDLKFTAPGSDFRPAPGSPLIGATVSMPADLPAIFAEILAEVPALQPHSAGSGYRSRTSVTASGALEPT